MKKINSNKNIILKIVLLVLLIVIFAILMFQPERFSYPYSMKDIKLKKETFDSLNTQILQEQQILIDKQKEYAQVSEEYDSKQQNMNEVSNNLNMTNLNLHIPSLLVVLEEKAVENNLNILIRYDEKEIISNTYTPPMDMSEGVVPEGVVEEPVTIEPVNLEEVVELENDMDISMITPIDGLNILVLPLEVEGDYQDLREFITFLDTMDFIIPYSVNVEAQGDYVIGEVIVQIFYEGDI